MIRIRALSNLGFQFAALYTALFVMSVAVLGAAVFTMTRANLAQQLDERVAVETESLKRVHQAGGLTALQAEVARRASLPGRMDYGLFGPGLTRLAGMLPAPAVPEGWTVARVDEGHLVERERMLVTVLPDGVRLIVSSATEPVEEFTETIIHSFATTVALVLFLGGAGGWLLSRSFVSRIDAIGQTAEAIIDGDLRRRIPVTAGQHDDLSRLATTLNRMLDRIAALLESLRQVSNDIAHDLRTPLTRLRHRLEAALAEQDAETRTAAIERAIAESEGLMQTFDAVLRISQVEAGARRSAFQRLDLRQIAVTVVEAYGASAEDQGGSLQVGEGGPVMIDGDQGLLTQLLANLLENGLVHAGPAPALTVSVRHDRVARIEVADNGPGIPPALREKVFERFYRIENSRTGDGNGLGLALARAITRLHGGEIWLEDASPGLRVCMSFPAPAPTRRVHSTPT